MAAAVAKPVIPQTIVPPGPSASSAPSAPSAVITEDAVKQELLEPGIDVTVLKELAKRALIEALNSVAGAKTLVLDPTLAGPLGLVTEVALLKQHGVDKMFWLEAGNMNSTTKNIVYLCRPNIRWMKIIADQIRRHTTVNEKYSYTLLLVPRRTILCDRVLEEEGVFGDITIGQLKMEFIPLEDDLLSLEFDNAYKDIFLDGDYTVVYYAAQALMTLQQAYGLFPRILGKGDAAKKLAGLLLRMRQTALSDDPTSPMLSLPSTSLDSLIIIDRSADMITPMCTQLTYEGLIDELIGIRNSYVEVDAALLSGAPQGNQPQASSSTAPALSTTPTQPRKKKHLLNTSQDPVLAELRDLNFAIVATQLNRLVKRLNEDYEGRHKAQTVQQLKDFVGKIGNLQAEHQSLRLHTGLVEQIVALTQTEIFNKSLEVQQNLVAGYDTNTQVAAIEDLINKEAPFQMVMRLLCLLSITTGGIKPKVLENFKREVLQTYGYQYLPLLLSLSNLNLLNKAPSTHFPIASLRKHLRLLMDDISEQSPTDIAYTYSGYAPLSIRLVQCVTLKAAVVAAEMGEKERATERKLDKVIPRAHGIVGWKGFEETVKSIPGETFDEVQRPEGDGTGKVDLLPKGHTSTTVVCFLGGCTYAEVAALRWMNTQTKGRRYLICTTSMITGSSLIDSLSPAPWQLLKT